MKKFPFDDANSADYLAITNRINDALQKIEKSETIAATQQQLAKLAQCSRGTLRNRVHPLVELSRIKSSRKAKRKLKKSNAASKLTENKITEKRLSEQLNNSRCEVARWVDKYKSIESELKKARRANDLLKLKNDSLKTENKNLSEKIRDLEISQGTNNFNNVIPIDKLKINKS